MSKSILDRLNYLIALISEFAAAHHISAQQPYLYLRQFKGLTPGGLYYCKRFYLLYNQLFEKVPQVEEKSLSETDSESATLSTKKVPQLGEIFKPLHSATAQTDILPAVYRS